MGRDESGTLERLKAHRGQRLLPALTRHGGRLVKTTGDGALAEFASAVDALGAAIEFQQAVADANDGAPEDTRIVFRVGLHIGDVIVDDSDLYGDGVNIAARLEAEATPGGILVSRALREAVQGKVKARLEALGELQLKNIERPVRAFRVEWEAADWLAPAFAAATHGTSIRPSLAVLPFANMSGDAEQDYFAEGVSEDIVTALSRFRELTVISRGSSFTFKGQGLDVRQIADRLGVRYVLNGSLRKAGNRVRVTAELTDVSTGAQVWSDRYDRDLSDVFELQDDISRTVAGVIEPAILVAEIERARRAPPASLTAYDLYLRALPHLWSGTRDDIPKAIGLLRQSLALEADRAPTLAALAMSLGLAAPSGAQATSDTAAEAVTLARRAVDVDATDAFAQAIYGFVLTGPMGDYVQSRLHAAPALASAAMRRASPGRASRCSRTRATARPTVCSPPTSPPWAGSTRRAPSPPGATPCRKPRSANYAPCGSSSRTRCWNATSPPSAPSACWSRRQTPSAASSVRTII